MSKHHFISSSSLVLALLGALGAAQAEEPQLDQNRLQQQVREHAAIQANEHATGQPQRMQEQRKAQRQTRDERRAERREGNGQGGMGGRHRMQATGS